MYKIIGADQKEYGPVTAEQIQLWIARGRVNALTKTQLDGGDWKTLNQFPEFAAVLASPVTPRPSAVPDLSASSINVRSSGLALASLVLGLLGFFSCGVTAIVGLILGIVSLIQISKSNGTVTGRGTALAGTIISAMFLVMMPFGAAVFIPAFARAKIRAQSAACVINAQQLAMFTQVYASTHTNQLPAAATWCDDVKAITGTTRFFQCPENRNQPCGYSFNTNLSGMSIGKINPSTVLLFESDGGWNASGGPQQALRQSRHGGMIVVAFADGHAEAVSTQRLDQLRWKP